jgi:D-sedoheptulose 7-phosphate isomerase
MNQTDHFERRVRALIEASIATKQSLLRSTEVLRTVSMASETLARALKQGNKALLFGNGGSAADAQHIAAEFVGCFGLDRAALPALALSVNASSLTAIGNDFGFDRIFSRQLEAFGRSEVVDAVLAARKIGLRTIALTGRTGGKLKDKVDYCICVPSDETPRIQECHILIGHIISELVEREIFGQAEKQLDT